MFTLFAGVCRQAQRYFVSAGCAEHRISDSRVAAGGIKNYFAGIEPAAALAVKNHCQRRTILYGSSRVEVFGFNQDLNSGRQARSYPPQPQQGRVANLRFQIASARQTLRSECDPNFCFGNHNRENKTGHEPLSEIATGFLKTFW